VSLFINAFTHPGEDAARSQLDEVGYPIGDHVFDAILPADRAGDLFEEGAADIVGVMDGAGVDIGIDGDVTILDGDRFQGLLEGHAGGFHETGVVGSGDLKGNGPFDAGLPGGFHGGGDPVGGSGEDDLAGAVEVGYFQPAGVSDSTGFCLIGPDEGQHSTGSAVAGLLHESSPGGDEEESIFSGEVVGGGMGGEFTEGQAGGGMEVPMGAFFPENLEKGEAMEIEGGLAIAGFGELLLGAIEAGVDKFLSEVLATEVDEVLRRGVGVSQVFAHTDVLSALT